jgi:cytochrome b subunit of formate dehydrogenase
MHTDSGEFDLIRTLGRIFGWTAFALLLLTILTGYGITDFRIVTPLTFGILNKAVAQRLHPYTEVALVLLLLAHIAIALWARRGEGKKKAG